MALLVLYPVVIAVLIGFALSRGPDKPEVAFYSGLPDDAVVELGGEEIDLAAEGSRLFDEIDPVRVDSRAEAIQKVRDGDVLGALIIPEDLASNIQSTLTSGTVEVFYNAEDPAKKEFVENTIEAQVQRANAALTKRIAEESLDLLELISTGGEYSFLGQEFDVLGLERAERILTEVRKELPPGSPAREQLDSVIDFGSLARQNLTFSDDVLGVVGEPIQVKAEALEGGTTSLNAFAVALAATVSLMFITLLLAAGMLAVEREENAFARLVRGLVSKTAPAGGEGRAGRRLLERGLPAHAGRAGLLRRRGLGPLPAVARGAGGGRARLRGPGPGHRRSHARGAGGLAAGLHAGAPAGLPGARALGRGDAGRCTT